MLGKHMKRIRFGSMIAAVLMAAAACTAAAQQKPKPAPWPRASVGFVDTQRVLSESRASLKVRESLEAEMKKRLKEIEAGPKAQIERRKIALADDINSRREIALKQFIEKMNVAVRRIAAAEKLDAVFIEATYVDVRIDLTDKVIKELDSGR